MNTVGERLLKARKLRGISQLQLAAGTNNTRPLISMVEHGHSNLSVANLSAAAKALGVSTDYLCGLSSDPTPADQLARELAASATRVRDLEDQQAGAGTADDGDYVGVSEFATAAGSGAVVDDERVTGRIKFQRAWLARHGLVASQCRVIQVLGESMEPTLVDGCHDPRQPGQPAPTRRPPLRHPHRRRPDRQARRQGPSRRLAARQRQPQQADLADPALARRRSGDRRGQVGHANVCVRSDRMDPIVSDIYDALTNDGASARKATAAAAVTPRRKPRAAKGDSALGQRTPKADSTRPPSRRRVRVAEGIYKDRHGLAATVKVNGVQREIRFPAGTPLKTIRARRAELRASLQTIPRGERHTLTSDAERYLDQVTTNLIGRAERRRDVEAWLPRFGHLRTLALPEHLAALNAQLHEWRRTRAASTCNHRRHALMHLVRVLYGHRAAIDLADLVRFPLPLTRPRWVDRAHIEDILEQLAPSTRTSARLRLMHWTGMRPSQMGRLTRTDFRLADPVPYVSVPRGKGGRLAAIPLVDDALAAVHDFIAADAFGPWSTQSANKAIQAAARKAKREPFTVYQIRHSFATWLRHTGADVADIQDLYGHTHPATTRIYAAPTLVKQRDAIRRLQVVATR